MTKTIHPFSIRGKLMAMSSKSYFQRALAISSLTKGQTILNAFRWSDDAIAAKNVIQKMGAITVEKEKLFVNPPLNFNHKSLELNVGESGLSMRLFSAISMLYNFPITINGKGTLMKRSIRSMLDIIHTLNVEVQANNDLLPLTIQGPIKGGEYSIDCSSGSQFLSGLLMVLPLLNKDSIIHVSHLTSKPYIDMTLSIIRDFGVAIEHENYSVFNIQGHQKYRACEYSIEGDWSAAANFLVGAAMSGEITIKGLTSTSVQADRAILDVLKLYGALVQIDENEIKVTRNTQSTFEFDATDCPDLFPPLVVLAASVQGNSIIKGTNRLLNKESNRLESLMTSFGKLGLKMEARNNNLIIFGTSELEGGEMESYNDHRIAMAGCIAGSISKNPIIINNPNAISKSYPDFYLDLNSCSISK